MEAVNETVNERLKREAAQKRSVTTRRRLLGRVGAAVGAEVLDQATGGHVTKAILGLAGIGKETPTASKTTLEKLLDKGIKPTRAYFGDIKIIKGLPDYGMLGVHDQPIVNQPTTSKPFDWLNIETWNGVNVKDVNEFVVQNALFIDGGDNADSPKDTKRVTGEWMVGTVGTNVLGFKDEQPDYVSYGSTTGKLVIPISGQFKSISITDKGVLVGGTTEPLPMSEFGKVKLPPSK